MFKKILTTTVFILLALLPIEKADAYFGELSQPANKIMAGPTSGGSGPATFRSLVGADLPNPSSTTLGGIESYVAVSHQWINAISTSGVPSSTQPAFSDISGTASATQGGTGLNTSASTGIAQVAAGTWSVAALTVAQMTIANQAPSTCTTSKTIDWSTGNSFTLALTNGDTCALTFSNAASGQTIVIDYTQASSGGGTAALSYSTTVKWGNGTVPTMTTGNSATDTCTYKYNGTDYRGSCVQNMQ